MEKKVKVETFPSTKSAAIHGKESESKNLSIDKERGHPGKRMGGRLLPAHDLLGRSRLKYIKHHFLLEW